MTKKKWAMLLLFLGFLLAAVALFVRYNSANSSDKMQFTFKMHGDPAMQNVGMLGITSQALNSTTLLQGVLCVTHASEVSNVDLFMPDMGHGSSPPVLSKFDLVPAPLNIDSQDKPDYGCFQLSKMEMFMPGLWQVRVFYKNGETGLFDVNLNS